MRYLRSFNEGTIFLPEDLNELQSFCETYLAYLGFIKKEYYSLEDTLNDNFYSRDISKITFYIKQTN
jgi:hypothetical protein